MPNQITIPEEKDITKQRKQLSNEYDLQKNYPEYEFLSSTIRWYKRWLSSDNILYFTTTDWNRLMLLALLIDRYHKKPSAALMAEIRLNEGLLGATIEDRERIGLNIVQKIHKTLQISTEKNINNILSRVNGI